MFCLLMDRVLSLLPGMYEYVISYLDDLIIFSKDVEDHLMHIKSLFHVLKQSRLKLNLDKCSFYMNYKSILGITVTCYGSWTRIEMIRILSLERFILLRISVHNI